MTSLGPYNQVYSNFSIDIPKEDTADFVINENSVLYLLTKIKSASYFLKIVEKAKMIDYFNIVQNITIFVVLDDYFISRDINPLDDMDFFTAKRFIYDLILNFPLKMEIIKNQPVSRYSNRLERKMLITYFDGRVTVNNLNLVKMEKDYQFGNNIVYFIH